MINALLRLRMLLAFVLASLLKTRLNTSDWKSRIDNPEVSGFGLYAVSHSASLHSGV